MAELKEDLNNNPNELFLRSDLIGGVRVVLKIVAEIGGYITVILALAKILMLLSGVLTWVGIAVTPAIAQKIMIMATRGYLTANDKDKKSIRALASWINGGFSLERFHTPESYEKLLRAAEVAEKADTVLEKLKNA